MAPGKLGDETPRIGVSLSIFRDLRLAWQLFRDARVPIWTKAIPLLSLAYVIWPIDLLADPILGLGQLDDLGVIILGAKLFISLCSPALVSQYRAGDVGGVGDRGDASASTSSSEVIDTTYRVLEDHSSQ